MPTLPARIRTMPRSGIREIMDLAAGMPDVKHLEVGQPNFPTPQHVIDAAAEAMAAGYTTYTPNRGLVEVRETMVAKLARDNHINTHVDDVIVTAGAVNALFSALLGTVSPGGAILIPDPGWPNYAMIAQSIGARVIRYPLLPDNGYLPDMEKLAELAASEHVQAIIVNTPSNPTGAVFPRRVLRQIADLAARNDLYLISDECYEHIVFEGEHISPASLDTDAQIISVFSMSKSYAMTGWRVGYACGPSAVMNQVAKVIEPVISCATSVSQKAAQAALDGPQDCVAEMRAAYQRRRDIAVRRLADANMLVATPHGAFYIMADVAAAGKPSGDIARELARHHGVAVAPGDTFGPASTGVVRVSLATADDDLAVGIDRLTSYVAGS